MTFPQIFFLILALLASSAASYWYYRGQKKGQLEGISTFYFNLLRILRATGLFLILVLLIGFIVVSTSEEEDPPLIVFLQDESSSILLNKDSLFYKNQYPGKLQSLISEISENFETSSFAFSHQVSDSLAFNFKGKETDISSALQYVYDRFYNRNVGAVIIASDGIYNRGISPFFTAQLLNYVPVYSIALGDTTPQIDLMVQDIEHNKIAFLGNDFTIKIHAQAFLMQGNEYEIKILHRDKVIKSEKVRIDSTYHIHEKSFTLPASHLGVQKYTISLTAFDQELTHSNNVKHIYIDVIDSRQKILLMGKGPHPDIGAIKAALMKNKNYEVTVDLAYQPSTLKKDYSMVVYHNLPDPASKAKWQPLVDEGIPALYIVGSETNLNLLSQLNIGLQASVSKGSESVLPDLNKDFSLFTLDAEIRKAIVAFPPLFSPYTNFKTSPNAKVLAYQSVGGVRKENPLIVFTEKQGVKNGFILGEGLWRWRMYDGKYNENTRTFDDFIGKIIQVIATKDDKSRFRIETSNEWTEQDEVKFKGEFYNEALELFNQPEMYLHLKSDEGKEYNYAFLKSGDEYRLNIGAMPPGTYEWKAELTNEGKKYNKTGTFLVRGVDVEGFNTRANHGLLKDIAEQSGGKVFYPQNMQGLIEDLKNHDDIKPLVYSKEDINSLIDWKIIFALIAFCFLLEWFVRKYHGAL